MINFNPNVSQVSKPTTPAATGGLKDAKGDFSKFVKEYVSEVDGAQKESDSAIQDLLTGRNQDVTSVVAAVAKADMSFKLLVGVRNKIIEAYKQTMNMQL